MSAVLEVRVPDIGDFKDIPVLEVLVKPGMRVETETPLITLESDKATIDVPSPASGTVKTLAVSAGTKVSKGSIILQLDTDGSAEASAPNLGAAAAPIEPAPAPIVASREPAAPATKPSAVAAVAMRESSVTREVLAPAAERVYAGPSVRALARRLGVDLMSVAGSGRRSRILTEDVHAFVKARLEAGTDARSPASSTTSLPPWPQVDFERFGPVERREMSRIKKRSGANLARNWVTIPHVTNFDEADITELEQFRVEINQELAKEKGGARAGVKLTILPFLIKASAAALIEYPQFNASIVDDAIVYKKYCHVGFAADTPNGLVVPVIRDADKKGLVAIAQEVAQLAGKARDGKIALTDMEGGCFSVSSLGVVGGKGFTPIINAPEVAILGAGKTQRLPRFDEDRVVARLMLPISLSWDHRAVDGVASGRFLTYLSALLGDLRRWML